MADYYTRFSCLIDLKTAENAARAVDIYENETSDEAGDELYCDGFEFEYTDQASPGLMWIHGDAFGDPERVIKFVLRCATEFDLQGLWGFQYANTASRPRLDAFGGGAHVIDLTTRKTVAWIETSEWLALTLAEGNENV